MINYSLNKGQTEEMLEIKVKDIFISLSTDKVVHTIVTRDFDHFFATTLFINNNLQ